MIIATGGANKDRSGNGHVTRAEWFVCRSSFANVGGEKPTMTTNRRHLS